MRGARLNEDMLEEAFGIIPAYAGSTRQPDQNQAAHWDHPRVCGEHIETLYMRSLNLGSSPRMRGALSLYDNKTITYGIIPAYAGSTLFLAHNPITGRDHPRVCGEHAKRAHRCTP